MKSTFGRNGQSGGDGSSGELRRILQWLHPSLDSPSIDRLMTATTQGNRSLFWGSCQRAGVIVGAAYLVADIHSPVFNSGKDTDQRMQMLPIVCDGDSAAVPFLTDFLDRFQREEFASDLSFSILIPVASRATKRLLSAVGFRRHSEIGRLSLWPGCNQRDLANDAPFTTWGQRKERADPEFLHLLARTQIDTADCIGLPEFQTEFGADVCNHLSQKIASDFVVQVKVSGDMGCWVLSIGESTDAGVAILRYPKEHPAGAETPREEVPAVELLYFGLVPEYRQRGISSRALGQLLPQLGSRTNHVPFAKETPAITTLVDLSNLPAWSCYRRLGFEMVETKELWIRP